MDKRIIGLGVVLVILQIAVGAAAWSAGGQAEQARRDLDVARGDIEKLEARIKALEKKTRIDFIEPDDASPNEDGKPRARVATPTGKVPGDATVSARSTRRTPSSLGVGEDQLAELFDPNSQPEVREKIQGLVRDELAIEREERHKRRMERMKEHTREEATEFAQELGLDEESTKTFSDYIVSEREKAMTLWREGRDSDIPREELRAQMDELRKETDREVAVLLDEEQYKDYTAKREEELERFRNRGGRGGRGGR